MKRLSYRQVLEITAGKPVDELILVGGQALNAWAEALGVADEATEGLYGAALSDDIDFFGMAPAAIALADALGAHVAIAQPDDHTPNAAVLTFDFEGEKNIIDVLHSLQGFSTADLQQLRKWAATPEMPAAAGHKLRVMHPLHCLQSQLENVYGLALNRREGPDGARNVNRVRLARECVRRTIQRYTDGRDVDSVRAAYERLYELSSNPPALRARAMDGVDLVDRLPRDESMGSDFIHKRLPQLQTRLQKAQAKHEALRQRQGALRERK